MHRVGTGVGADLSRPAKLQLVGVLAVLAGAAFGWIGTWGPPSQDELVPVSGRLVALTARATSRSGHYLDLDLDDGGARRQLSQIDVSFRYPAISRLKAGDAVTALVKPDEVGRDLAWYWEVRRGSEVVLSYEQMAEWEKLRNGALGRIGKGCLLAGLALFAAGRAARWFRNRQAAGPVK